MHTTPAPLSLPVLRDVDLLIVGASTGAVAAALAARAAGRSVMVVSELSYFGEESAGTLNLWSAGLDLADPLLAAAFADTGDRPARPAAVKRALETALLAADVPFLYFVRPVALLRDAAGHLAGALLAARSSLLAVTCRAVVDASRYGVVARLAGLPLSPRTDLPATLAWTVIADGTPIGWTQGLELLAPPFRQTLKEVDTAWSAYRLTVPRADLGAEPRAREHVLRSLLTAPNVLITADIVPDVPAERWAAPGVTLVAAPAQLADQGLTAAPGLWLLNGLLPLTVAGVQALERSDVQAALGRRLGALAAAALPAAVPGTGALTAHTGGTEPGDYGFAPAFLRQSHGTLTVPALTFPVLGSCGVAVAGGGTGGAPAGIAAARAGAATVVLEQQHALGGVGTVGLIASYWFGNKVGFTAELNEAVMQLDGESRGKKGNIWRPEIKIGVYHRLLQQAGGAAWLGSFAFGVRRAGDQVTGLLVSTPFGSGLLTAGCTVDATGSADVAAAAGAPCRVLGGDHLAVQGVGLSPRVHPGVRHQNSDHTFIDDSDAEGVTAAFVHARAKYPRDFDTSAMVNSRERRQIQGDCEISPLDLLAQRTFPDTVFTASSNFDTHGFIIHPVFMVAVPDHEPLQAHVPFRCMLPRGVEGVVVTGLGMSAHRDALPVVRMQADVQNQGYAAGRAAATAAAATGRLRAVDIRALQQHLVAVGILAPEVAAHTDSFPLPAAAVAAAAAGPLTKLMNAAILIAHPAQSRPLLHALLQQEPDAARRTDAALILGLLGDPAAAPVLLEAVRAQPWDAGWNYRGMGQFGLSMSRLDALILALARTGAPAAGAVLAAAVRQLDASAAFSHCRVVALAAALLRDAALTQAVADLLDLPGMTGHAQLTVNALAAGANGDPVETASRNAALKELYLASGLYRAGDRAGRGRALLLTYTNDLRGHCARYARAVLAAGATASPLELA